jgi:tight adherence protein B
MFSSETFLLVSALLFGLSAFVLIYQFTINGLQLYQGSFINKVDHGMKNAFIYMDPKMLFTFQMLAILAGGVLGYLFAGIVGIVLVVAGVAALPGVILRVLRQRRADRFVYQLPDALSSIASSLRSGSNLAKAMSQIAEQQPAPISQEFSVILSEYKMGRVLEDSLQDMYKRIDRQEVDLLNSAITISRSVGGNLADTLDTLAKTLREKAQVEGKIKALTAMGRMQGWVVGFIPVGVFLMLRKQEPEGMNAMFTDLVGWVTLFVISVMMIVAVMMIRKIVNIDV